MKRAPRIWPLSLVALAAVAPALMCGGGRRSLIDLDVDADTTFTNETLRILAVGKGGSVMPVFRMVTIGPNRIYKVGVYLPSDVEGTITITGTIDDGTCVRGKGGPVTVAGVASGETASAPRLTIKQQGGCEQIMGADAGVDGGGSDAARDVAPGTDRPGGSGGMRATGTGGGPATGTGGMVGAGTGGAGNGPGTGGNGPGTGGNGPGTGGVGMGSGGMRAGTGGMMMMGTGGRGTGGAGGRGGFGGRGGVGAGGRGGVGGGVRPGTGGMGTGGMGTGGMGGAGGTPAQGTGGGMGGAGGACVLPTITCDDDLSNIGTGDFEIRLTVRTLATAESALLSQRRMCDRGVYWDARLVNGAFSIELDDSRTPMTCAGSHAVNDGAAHRIVARRTSGQLTILVDCVVDTTCSSTADLNGGLPPLQMSTPCVGVGGDGTLPLVGTINEVCVSSSP